MDNLLCDESWLSGPLTPEPLLNFRCNNHYYDVVMSPAMDAATVEEAMTMDLEKESCSSNHRPKFLEFLVSKKLTDARFQAVQWLIQTRSRLNLSFETLFSAANCFDRFIYLTSCNEWTNWMVELVILTSLSIASKFNEVTSSSLQELQMEGLNHMFHHKTILEMELIVLRALEWRVNFVTSYSFLQILMLKIGLVGDNVTTNRITDHLLDDLCDFKIVEFLPSVVAVAATCNVLEEKEALDDNLGIMMSLFGEDRKEDIMKCVNVMKSRNVGKERKRVCELKSLASMLQRREVKKINRDYQVGDLSVIFKILRSEGSDQKRKRDNYEDKSRPAKRTTFVMSI